MNQLDITIGGKTFTIACQAGEEEDVRRLGAAIDAKFQDLAPRYDQNLLFASLMLADDLQSAQTASEKAKADMLAAAKAMEDLHREVDTATAQRDQLRQTIADREQELERLKAATLGHDDTVATLRNEIEQLRNSAESARAEVGERAEVETAELRASLVRLQGERDQLASQLEQARQAQSDRKAPSAFIEAGMSSNDPELAPALERFAELLENCAIKLEGGLEGRQPSA